MCRCFTGMYYESAGREVQIAGSSGGSYAEGAEVSPTTEGMRHLPAKHRINSFFTVFNPTEEKYILF